MIYEFGELCMCKIPIHHTYTKLTLQTTHHHSLPFATYKKMTQHTSSHALSCTNLDDCPEPMDKPRQSDSFAGHVEGQIAGIAFGSVGAPLYNHERRGRKQQPTTISNV